MVENNSLKQIITILGSACFKFKTCSKAVTDKLKSLFGKKVGSKTEIIIPDKIDDLLVQITKRKGNPPNGYKGNKNFENIKNKLPIKDKDGNNITYKEYDVNPTPPKGTKRDSERIIIGSDGKKYYTKNHYETFTEIK